MNEVNLLGNLVRDVELRYTSTGKAMGRFTIAATSVYLTGNGEAKEQTSFINCVAWGNNAEYVSQGVKGSRIFAKGRIVTRSYEQDGIKKYATEVVAEFVALHVSEGKMTSNFDSMAKEEEEEEIPF